MIKISNVLVATDFGPAADSALTYGREFARTFGAKLHVLHVVQSPLAWAGTETAGMYLASLQSELEAAARTSLDKLITAEDRDQLKAVPVIRTDSSPAVAIASYARDAAADIIIMGTHGRGVVGQLLMGSVADKVVRSAGCPVLTVRHPEHEFLMPDAIQVKTVARA
jgi:nucleotide-binding universal stress UspA family protein